MGFNAYCVRWGPKGTVMGKIVSQFAVELANTIFEACTAVWITVPKLVNIFVSILTILGLQFSLLLYLRCPNHYYYAKYDT